MILPESPAILDRIYICTYLELSYHHHHRRHQMRCDGAWHLLPSLPMRKPVLPVRIFNLSHVMPSRAILIASPSESLLRERV